MTGKRIVLCLDGTWNRADDTRSATNIVAMMRAIAPVAPDGTKQIVFYNKGVGTGGGFDRIKGGIGGSGLSTNVRDAYIFLGNNYVPGDEVFVFGFSRGAFTARSLVGFIGASGLLDRWSMGRLNAAWDYYQTPPRERDPAQREALESQTVTVECLGVWDTVGSLGLPLRWFSPARWFNNRFRFHDASLSPQVHRAFHALAVDEKRGPFAPTLWDQAADETLPQGQIVEQVWFTGAHSDVGGGYGRSDKTKGKGGLSQLSLRWMIRRVQETTDLAFHEDCERITSLADPLAPMHESRSWMYTLSRVLPYQRVIGGRSGWTRNFAASRNIAKPGRVFVNEMLHESVLERVGQEVETLRKGRRRRARYDPASVAAAKGHVPVVTIPARASPTDASAPDRERVVLEQMT